MITAIISFLIASMWGAVIIGAFLLILLIVNLVHYSRSKRLMATPMICPLCGSRNVKIRSQIAGVTGTGVYGSGIGIHNSAFQRSRILGCLDCGYDVPFITQADITAYQAKTKRAAVICLILLIVFGAFWWWLMYGHH